MSGPVPSSPVEGEKTAHTPGPWEWQSPYDHEEYPSEKGRYYVVGSNLGGLIGAALPWATELDSGDFRRVEANARLIAAAPDLLQALLDIKDAGLKGFLTPDLCADIVTEAIARAEGRAARKDGA